MWTTQTTSQPQVCTKVTGWWNPATLIAGIMLLTIIEGAFRKWVFASNPALRYATYFSKDVLFFYAGYLGLRRAQFFRMSWQYVCVALIILPSASATLLSSNPVGAFLSLRAYVLVPLCAYSAASLIRNIRDIERCALVVAVAAPAVAALSVHQYSLPNTHFLNRYETGTEATITVMDAGHVRATGTFSYISGMGMLAAVSAWAGTFLALPMGGRPAWLRVVGCVAIVAGFVCCATSMSRTGLMLWGCTIIGACFLYFQPKHIFAAIIAIVMISPFVFGVDSNETSDTITPSNSLSGGLTYRLKTADSFSERATFVLTDFYLGCVNHPLGEGLGVGQPGGGHAEGTEIRTIESEWGRIALELGPIGLVGVLWIRFGTCFLCWKYFTLAPCDQTRLVLATSLPFFGMLALGNMAFNHTGNTFAWLVMTCSLAAVTNFGVRAGNRVTSYNWATFTSRVQGMTPAE